ncbi:HD domain-containing protein [Candidatus Falkowbacteria bacterium]|mgnify:CR=1 FL=1|jgi:3'-5' exoribonuclease|nr:HD domain-containing protein [Candidatus Falkowbacteria bacterium]MBT6573505.1 HD domain-containing protein [Candidatus Falkowbacteria bacterium]MBT7348055.1 HD domain-containing protein [Candidatus Falkowbacteria bacterium]MBT7501110.1 HD domain-containing protein [Candidatus Falkowbacteria bacterium]
MNQSSLVSALNGNSDGKHFIEDLQTGDKLVNEQFAVKSIRNGKTSAGKDYTDLTLGDKTGEIMGKIWESNLGNCQEPKLGQVVELSGTIDEFRNKLQIKITFLQQADDFNLSNFLPTSKKDQELLWQTVEANIKLIKGKYLKSLVESFFKEESFAEKFKLAPGAENIHHAYVGGLMEHVVEMLNLGNSILTDFEDLNRDLLITGILLHDIGKMQELAIDHTIYRTLEGNLAGHISLGVISIDKEIDKIKNFPTELRAKVLNLVLGHHEKLEYGSPVKPMIPETFALAYIDNLSAKVNTAQKVINENKNSDAEYSDRNYALETKLYLN